jgi:hypothetical protein
MRRWQRRERHSGASHLCFPLLGLWLPMGLRFTRASDPPWLASQEMTGEARTFYVDNSTTLCMPVE